MISIKEYIAKQFINKRIHVKCDCLLPIDVSGVVCDYEIVGNEIVLYIKMANNKIIHIGLNTPSLQIEDL